MERRAEEKKGRENGNVAYKSIVGDLSEATSDARGNARHIDHKMTASTWKVREKQQGVRGRVQSRPKEGHSYGKQ